ncbi:MAG: hypothetical protein ACTH1D_12885 [Mycobacteriaceae bacterium]
MTENNAPQNQNQPDEPNEETRNMPTANPTPEDTNTTENAEAPRKKRKGLAIGAGAIAALLVAGGIGFGISEIADDDDDEVRTVTAAENQSSNQDSQDGDDRDDDNDAGNNNGDGNNTAGSDAASFRDAAEQAIDEAGGRGASSIDIQGSGHEVEVELDDNGSAEVHVSGDGAMTVETDSPDMFDQEDPTLDLATLEDAMDAALAAADEAGVSDGVVDSVSASDDRGVTYEVSVQGANGQEVDVDLADDFAVVNTDLDD